MNDFEGLDVKTSSNNYLFNEENTNFLVKENKKINSARVAVSKQQKK